MESSGKDRDESQTNESLDSAIRKCIIHLEQNDDTDVQQLIDQFPQWSDEIAEFLEDWGGMERVAGSFVEPDDLTTGSRSRRFANYELLEKIGAGGMGVIYKARQIDLDRIVAVKMVVGHGHDSDRFKMEAEAAGALRHPNIVSIHEIGEHRGRMFLTMPFVDGCNLKQFIEQQQVGPRKAAMIAEKLARAVHYAHQRGILHRDLKPANVLIDNDDQPHICDFGLAKRIEHDRELTRTGSIMGTPGYMAPEQASGKIKSVTMATDVYGLGAILYAMLTGQAPFSGESSLEILRRVVDEPVSSPRTGRPSIDRDIETICLKCLEKSPELRYASADLLAADLARYLDNQPVLARPVSGMERMWRWCRRNPVIAVLTTAVACLLVATAVTSIFLAISEKNAHIASLLGKQRENQLRGNIKQTEMLKERATLAATESQADLYTAIGAEHASSGNVAEAVLWFTQAAKLIRDPDRLRTILIACRSRLRHHPLPIAATILEEGFPETSEMRPQNRLSFRPSNTDVPGALLCRSGDVYSVWNFEHSGELWQLNELIGDITCAAWSPDGNWLAVGSGAKILLLDPDFRSIQREIEFDSPVNHLVFSPNGGLIAVSYGNQFRIWDTDRQNFLHAEPITHPKSVVRLIFDKGGTRLASVTHFKEGSRVYVHRIENDAIKKLFEVRCQYLDIADHWRPFWPVFVMEDSALLIRKQGQRLEMVDSTTGKRISNYVYAHPIYSMALPSDGNIAVVGVDGSAPVYQFRQSNSIIRTKPAITRVGRLKHANQVFSTAFGRSGIAATAGSDKVVRLWNLDASSQTEIERVIPEKPSTVLPHQAHVSMVSFSSDGSQLATAQTDGLIRVWNLPAVRPNGYQIKPGKLGGSLVKLVGDKHWMVSGMTKWTGNVRTATVHENQGQNDPVFETQERESRGNENQYNGHVMDAASAPDLTRIATVHAPIMRSGITMKRAGEDAGTLRLWSFPDGEPLPDKAFPMPSEPRSVDFHPDGKLLAVCTARMEIVLFNVETSEIESIIKPKEADRENGVQTTVFPAHIRNQQLRFSPSGDTIVAWGSSDGLWIWDVNERTLRYPVIPNNNRRFETVEFSRDGSLVALAGGLNRVASVLNIETGQFVGTDLEHPAAVQSARFSPDEKMLITGCRDGHVRMFDWNTGELHLGFMAHNLDVVDARWTPDGRHFATIGADNRFCVWGEVDGLALKPFEIGPDALQLLITPDSRYAIVAGGMPTIHVFDLAELNQNPQFSLDQLRETCELLTGKTFVDGTITSISSHNWLKEWENQQGNFIMSGAINENSVDK